MTHHATNFRSMPIGLLLAMVTLATSAFAQLASTPNADKTRADITALLTNFLSPAQNSKAESHDRFWAKDLVYTGSSGVVRSKADIMRSMSEAPKADVTKAAEPATVFSAEDILVRPYGDMAALTFRLVGKESNGVVNYYRNSGTFLFRDGKWQAITWQATKVPPATK